MNDKKPTPLHPGWLAGDTEEPSDADYRLVFAEVEKRIAETGESFDDAVMNVAKSDDRKGYLIAYVQFDAVRALDWNGLERHAGGMVAMPLKQRPNGGTSGS